jgi:hypothetical protein
MCLRRDRLRNAIPVIPRELDELGDGQVMRISRADITRFNSTCIRRELHHPVGAAFLCCIHQGIRSERVWYKQASSWSQTPWRSLFHIWVALRAKQKGSPSVELVVPIYYDYLVAARNIKEICGGMGIVRGFGKVQCHRWKLCRRALDVCTVPSQGARHAQLAPDTTS